MEDKSALQELPVVICEFVQAASITMMNYQNY